MDTGAVAVRIMVGSIFRSLCPALFLDWRRNASVAINFCNHRQSNDTYGPNQINKCVRAHFAGCHRLSCDTKASGRLRITRCSLGPLSRTNKRTGHWSGHWSQPTVAFILPIAPKVHEHHRLGINQHYLQAISFAISTTNRRRNSKRIQENESNRLSSA